MDQAVDRAHGIMKKGGYIVTPNPEIVLMSRKDKDFKDILNGADMVIPDGIGIIYGAKILGSSLNRVTGIDLACEIMKRLAEKNGRVYLLGAKPKVAEAAAENLKNTFSGIVIAGTSDGYFEDSEPILKKIRDSRPDLLIVCLGAPKQEKWIHSNRDKLPPCLMMGLGGALDIYAGNLKRAPERWRKHGFEWLYRLITQPSRIWRMLRLPVFLLLVILERLKEAKKTVGV
jgi:N-acetylglucosaminyldiphosphoundecaprenol N-acetyl-beta-D-mannosaminyltransferase